MGLSLNRLQERRLRRWRLLLRLQRLQGRRRRRRLAALLELLQEELHLVEGRGGGAGLLVVLQQQLRRLRGQQALRRERGRRQGALMEGLSGVEDLRGELVLRLR